MTGGLGNQFFQYAAAKSLAIKHNVSVGLNLTSLNGNEKEGHFRRKFKLDRFNTNFKKMSLNDIRKYIWVSGNKFIDDRILQKFGLFEKKVWHDNGNVSDLNSQSDDVYLLGYFVNPNYFNGLRNVFLKEFELKDKSNIEHLLKDIKKSNSVSVHVRRGDLLKLKNSYTLEKDYYLRAFKVVEEKIKSPRYYFFSDDIDWCKKNFGDLKDVVFVEENDVTEDFELMKNCKHNILANSTLSWWAAYLNSNRNPIVIAPKHFNIYKTPTCKMQLNEWIVI